MLINGTAKAVKTIELAPAGTSTWQPNRVDPDFARVGATVKPGARTVVHFDKGAGCRYDVKIGFTDSGASIWRAINLCDNSYVTVKYNALGMPIFTAN